MRYRKLSPDGDYTFGGGQLDFYRDVPEAVGQAVKTRLMLWLGEWFLNADEGTPYMLGVIGKHSQASADRTIKERIIDTPGVVNISAYTSVIDADNRRFAVTCSINTIFGPTTVQIQNSVNF